MKTETIEEIEIVEEVPRFKGYTLDEIRYQRAMLGVRKEFCKAKVMESLSNLKPGGRRRQSGFFAAPSKPSFFSIAGKVASKFLGNLNTLDYILMGISAFGTVKKGVRLLTHKKK